jgi:hypothetical protein
MGKIDALMAIAIDPKTLRLVGSYTEPRSYGVYKITKSGNVGRRYRFGNHRVRANELDRDYGGCEIEALFRERGQAKELADHLNSL